MSLVGFALVRGASAGGVIEGDRDLLRLLIAAQEANRSSFQRGALDAVVHSYMPGQTVDVTAHLVWDRDSTYWDYEQTLSHSDVPPGISKAKRIKTPENVIIYWPAYKLAQVGADQRGASMQEELRLRPDDSWFCTAAFLRTWSELFDPGSESRPPTVSFEKMVIRKEANMIIVERHNVGRVYRIRASLDKGANVIDYETTPTREHPEWKRGEFEWLPLPDNRWRLRSHKWVFSLSGAAEPSNGYSLEVTSFDPNPVIVENRFRIESLGIEPDTFVENLGAARSDRRRAAKEPPAQRRLDELAEQLRQRGFAATHEESR